MKPLLQAWEELHCVYGIESWVLEVGYLAKLIPGIKWEASGCWAKPWWLDQELRSFNWLGETVMVVVHLGEAHQFKFEQVTALPKPSSTSWKCSVKFTSENKVKFWFLRVFLNILIMPYEGLYVCKTVQKISVLELMYHSLKRF